MTSLGSQTLLLLTSIELLIDVCFVYANVSARLLGTDSDSILLKRPHASIRCQCIDAMQFDLKEEVGIWRNRAHA